MAIQKNFVIKNGLEVDTNLILADAQTNKVGIGTTVPQYTLHVNGGIGATDLYVSGIGTFSTLNADDINLDNAFINIGVITSIVSTSGTITSLSGANLNYSGISTLGIITSNQINSQNLKVTGISTLNNIILNGYLSIGNTTGTEDQYLASVGTGVTWKSVVVPRTSTVYSAGIGSTAFSATYEIGLIDVYVNGVRLVPPPSGLAEFTASNGSIVFLNDPCFGGEIVELVVYNQL